MQMTMYAIKDNLSGFSTPIPFTNEEMAKRYFKTQLNENAIMRNTPEDFSLYYMGEFYTETGIFLSDEKEIKKIM